jgi:acetyl esterase
MSYATGTEQFLARYHDAMPTDFIAYPVDQQRRLYLSLSEVFPYPMPEGVHVQDREVHTGARTVPLRVYRPTPRRGTGLLVYFRGGGFVVGSLDSHHTLVAELAAKTGLTTVAPDFRQAPEHPFPAAVDDCYHTIRALAEQPDLIDPDIETAAPVLCGDSSGANLAVTVSMACRDRGGVRPKGQGLVSPVLDFARWYDGGDDPSFGPEMQYYTRAYCPDRPTTLNPHVSPLINGQFHDLPPAYILSTELDILRSDSDRYAEALQRSGIPVQHVTEPGLVHAPLRGRSLIPAVADAWDRFCHAVGRLATA